METVNIIETAEELINLARKLQPNECVEGPLLGNNSSLLFENEMKSVSLRGEGADGFELSEKIPITAVIEALCLNANFKCHIT